MLAPALEALNHAQSVLWTINQDILELVTTCYEQGVFVEGLPPKDDLPKPAKGKWEDMSEDERKAWKKKASSIRMANIGYIGERTVLGRDLAQAKSLLGQTFHTPMNFDYRGRVYSVCFFNYQRQDHLRAMFCLLYTSDAADD